MHTLYQNARKWILRLWPVLFLLAAAIVAAGYGLERIFDVDFVVTNGDYQNYNVLRRVLAGQVPYRDFANYLGMGLLVLCAPLVALHNTFAGSLFVTHFVASLAFILLVTLVFYLVTGNKWVSMLAGLMMPKLLSSGLISCIPVYGYYCNYYLGLLAAPMNSFRVGRLLLPVLLCYLALFLSRRSDGARRQLLTFSGRGYALAGFAVGLGLTWSNDFGFACIGSATLVLLILALADCLQNRRGAKAFAGFLWYLPALLIGAFISILIASGGHVGSWLAFTKGVSSWQWWYYGERLSEKLLSVTQLFTAHGLPRTMLHFGIFLACMAFCLWRLCRRQAGRRTVLFVFLFCSVVAGHVLYMFGSAHDAFPEGTYDIVLLTVFALAVKGLLWLLGRLRRAGRLVNAAVAALAALYTVFMLCSAGLTLRDYRGQRFSTQQSWVARQEGVSPHAAALREMQDTVGDAPMFATFATALDDIRGSFQPTGCDYIIHALGDEQFADYVANFTAGRYPWVQTTNTTVWPWENWMVRANWEFYRELLSDYDRHSDHGYWALWQYAGPDANRLAANVQLTVQPQTDGSWLLTVESDEQRPCFVDVVLDWQLSPTDSFAIARRLLFIQDDHIGGNFEGWFRPTEGHAVHLPVYMTAGTGCMVMQPVPAGTGALEILQAYVDEVVLDQMTPPASDQPAP